MTMTITENTNIDYGFRFQKWDIYKDARVLRREVNTLLKTFPETGKFALTDQLRRATNSILLNIAEGSNKNTDKDTRLCINRAHGSLDEIVACLDCALDNKYITDAQYDTLLEKASSLAKRLRNFGAHLLKSS